MAVRFTGFSKDTCELAREFHNQGQYITDTFASGRVFTGGFTVSIYAKVVSDLSG
jgi:hypothetical protein